LAEHFNQTTIATITTYNYYKQNFRWWPDEFGTGWDWSIVCPVEFLVLFSHQKIINTHYCTI